MSAASNSDAPKDDELKPEEFVTQERFKCVCPTNGATYSDIGDPDGAPVVMLCGSGMDCVLTGVLFHAYCKEQHLRMICPNKPGMGSTPTCPLNERVRIFADYVEGILQHLNVQPVALVSISSGFIYGLYILAHKQHIFGTRNPALLALAPWISFEDAPSMGFASFAPDALISAVPAIMTVLNSPTLQRALSWSIELSSSVGSSVRSAVSGPVRAAAETDPGRGSIVRGVSREAFELVVHRSVSTGGLSDEYLLCLRRGAPGVWGYKDYPEVLSSIAAAAGQKRVLMRLYCGDADGMVPRKAQMRFSDFFADSGPTALPASVRERFDYREVTIEKGGHNDVATFRICWDDILAHVSSASRNIPATPSG
ncbi:hypothetical protein AURDEDRAFT_113096 [Auricularia subglabra TFB-10046 SS5]|nr:hypothetical protein AURDEDRAFT_113096 [Auricularia subglabra TFB-10046 SS5]